MHLGIYMLNMIMSPIFNMEKLNVAGLRKMLKTNIPLSIVAFPFE